MDKFKVFAEEDHLCVISDLHLGNPAFLKNDVLRTFLEYISSQNISLCINGDGMDFLQYSIAKLAYDLQNAIETLRIFWGNKDNKIYYVIGNHDIFLEPHLNDSGIFNVVPFLDVLSGERLIHIEHGHLNDFLFLYFPNLYVRVATLLGWVISFWPSFFNLYERIEWSLYGLVNKEMRVLKNAPVDFPQNISLAQEVFARGFDAVIFGHTHRHTHHVFDDDRVYANAGTWTTETIHYIDIERGSISLQQWPQ